MRRYFTRIPLSKGLAPCVVGGVTLTPREVDVLACILAGRSIKMISALLSIAPKTVETHTHNVMSKLKCHSRDAIISCLEKSDRRPFLLDHYMSLVTHAAFESCIQKLEPGDHVDCHLLCLEGKYLTAARHLEKDLKKAGVRVTVLKKESEQALNTFVEKSEKGVCIVLLPEDFSQKASWGEKVQKEGVHLIFFPEEGAPQEKGESYYTAFFSVLKCILPKESLQGVESAFSEKVQALSSGNQGHGEIQGHSNAQSQVPVKKNRQYVLWIFLLMILLLGGAAYRFYHKTPPVEGITNLPKVSWSHKYLKRESILRDIQTFTQGYKRKNQSKNPVVLLLGIGGSGKTTLERMFSKRLKKNLLWEINAESLSSQVLSYVFLAKNLARHKPNDQKILGKILTISNEELKLQELNAFIKERIQDYDWMLVFDNVSNVKDSLALAPLDARQFGKGLIVLVSRNSNLKNSPHVDFAVEMGALSDQEKYDLFLSIYDPQNEQKKGGANQEKIMAVLKRIPPFPLDVSIAAYYLKMSNISFDAYEKRLRQFSPKFHDLQKRILQDVGDYQHTRYEIVSLSLKKFIEENAAFKDLLFLISVVDYNYIPLELLYRYKDPIIVDKFLYYMNIYSFILSSKSNSKNQSYISLHPSTQFNIRAYFWELLNKGLYVKEAEELSKILIKYMKETLKEERFSVMGNVLLQHGQSLIKRDILGDRAKARLLFMMGLTGHHLGIYDRSVEQIQESIALFKRLKDYDYLHKAMGHLGGIYCDTGQYGDAFKVLSESQKVPTKHLTTRNDRYLGDALLHMGHYKEAKHWFQRAVDVARQKNIQKELALAQLHYARYYTKVGEYDKALSLFNWCKSHYERRGRRRKIAKINGHLGQTYIHLGDILKARKLYEESLAYYTEIDDNVRRAWIEGKLAKVCINLGEYDKAEALLKHCIHVNTLCGNDRELHKAKTYLGYLYFKKKKFQKAQELLSKTFPYKRHHYGSSYIGVIYLDFLLELIKAYKTHQVDTKKMESFVSRIQKHYRTTHYMYARVLQEIGDLYAFLGRWREAEDYTHRALSAFKEAAHPDIFSSYAQLGFIHEARWRKSDCPHDQKRAKEHFDRARMHAKAYFPKASANIQKYPL